MKEHLSWDALSAELDDYPENVRVMAAIDGLVWEVGSVAEVKAKCHFAYDNVPPVIIIGDKHYYALATGEYENCPVIDLVEFEPLVWKEG